MIIHKHHDEHFQADYITVEEALPVEQIAVELFECPQPWLRIWNFSDDADGVHGKFSISASNGTWVYQFTRKLWWLDGVYEAKLTDGVVLRNPVSTTAASVVVQAQRVAQGHTSTAL